VAVRLVVAGSLLFLGVLALVAWGISQSS